MINLEPIPKKIQKRLFEKMRALGRQSNSTTGKSIDTDALTHEKMASRTTFIRMTSGQANAVTLMGGMLKRDGGIRGGYDDIYGSRNYPKITRDESVQDTAWELFMDEDYGGFNEDQLYDISVEGIRGTLDDKTLSNTDRRPMPGIKSIDVQFKGGQKAHKEAIINWTCWSFEDLNELSPHFLAHGKTVMIQWGWVYDDKSFRDIPEFLTIDSVGNRFISEDAFTNYKNTVIDGKGDFDIMTGVIKNFEYTTREDGAFDCTTILSSVGVNLVTNPQPNEESLSKHITYNLSLNDTNKEVASKLINATLDEDGELSKLNPVEKSKLVNLNTNVSLKLFLKNIDDYIFDQLGGEDGPSDLIINKKDKTLGTHSVPLRSEAYNFKENCFIQHVLDIETKDAAFSGMKVVPNGTWVSWGWFEDNILSKFTTQVSKDGRIVNTFRSIEAILDKKENKDSGKYESVRIKNHKYMQTIDTKIYILPGQFEPHQKDKYYDPDATGESRPFQEVDGDGESIKKLASIVNDINKFESFTASSEIEKVEYIDSDLIGNAVNKVFKEEYGLTDFALKQDKYEKARQSKVDEIKANGLERAKEAGFTSTKTGLSERRFGYLRNMLINTKVIKDSFGVSENLEEFTVESLSIEEAMNNLFSILNQPINFWDFELTADNVDVERVKIIDRATTAFNFKKSVNSQRSKSNDTGEPFTENKPGDSGVFFFPVWRADSIVKRQNVTAKVPDAMALTAMYGSNLDQLKEFSNVGDAYEDKGAVLAGGLHNSDADIRNRGLTVAIKSGDIEDKQWQNIGSVNHIDNERLIKNGKDDVLSYIKQNAKILEKTYTDRLEKVQEDLIAAKTMQEQAKRDKKFAEAFDTTKPPPLFENLNRGERYTLLTLVSKLLTDSEIDELSWYTGVKDNTDFKELFSAKYTAHGKMKRSFIETVKYLTLGNRSDTKTRESSILIPLDIELDIDGTGGIFPGNSFHSNYLPTNYKSKAVFQMFDVSHKVDGSGWTTSITGKMRTTMGNVFSYGKTYDELEGNIFDNYLNKVVATTQKQKDKKQEIIDERNAAYKKRESPATPQTDREKRGG